MAHYAFLDEDNVVTEVITGIDEEDPNDTKWEEHYSSFRNQVCKRTSYGTRGNVHYDGETNIVSADQSKAFRKNFALPGYVYDYDRDAFIPPQPFPSWTLDENSCLWVPPKPRPGIDWAWDEGQQDWIPIN